MTSRLQTTEHKRGDTFTRKVLVSDENGAVYLVGSTVTSTVKTPDYATVASLTTQISTITTGEITLSATDTASWPLTDDGRPLLCDVKIVSSDTVRTETFGIYVVRQITE